MILGIFKRNKINNSSEENKKRYYDISLTIEMLILLSY